MGVTIEDTWPSILTKKHGHTTYNLGVQGYSPGQMEGSFRLYGKNLKPRFVIIAYCPGTYIREKFFFDGQQGVKGRLCGGIESIRVNENHEIREQTKHVTTAIYLLFIRSYYAAKDNFKRTAYFYKNLNKYQNKLYKLYMPEILQVEFPGDSISGLESSREFNSALTAFLNIKKMADKIKAKSIFIYLPRRPYMYYEAATGRQLPPDNFEAIESEAFKRFCNKEGIAYLNPSQRVLDYVKGLDSERDISRYPYLRIDGHMSYYGYKLVADEILEYLNHYGKS